MVHSLLEFNPKSSCFDSDKLSLGNIEVFNFFKVLKNFSVFKGLCIIDFFIIIIYLFFCHEGSWLPGLRRNQSQDYYITLLYY